MYATIVSARRRVRSSAPESLWLVGGVERAARALGFEVARDTPFSGTFVPSALLGDTRVAAVMLELRRDTYMDEGTGLLHGGAAQVRELIRRVVAQMLEGE